MKFGLGWTCYVNEHSDICSLAFHGSLDWYRAAFPWSTSMGIKKVLWHRALASSSHNLEWNEDQAAPGIWMTLQPHLEGRRSCILVLLQMLSSGQQPRPHLGTSEKHRIQNLHRNKIPRWSVDILKSVLEQSLSIWLLILAWIKISGSWDEAPHGFCARAEAACPSPSPTCVLSL